MCTKLRLFFLYFPFLLFAIPKEYAIISRDKNLTKQCTESRNKHGIRFF